MNHSETISTEQAFPTKQPLTQLLRQAVPPDAGLFGRLMREAGTWVMLIFGLAPVAFNLLFRDVETQALWITGYFTLGWAAYFYVAVGKRAVNLWLGMGSALFMLFMGVPIGRFLHFHLLMPFYEMTSSPSAFVQWMGNVLSHGLNEEMMKALSVLLLAFGLRQVKKPIDGVFYGALSGLGFAAWEGHKFIVEAQTPAVMMMTVAIRSTTNCFLHASFTGISGYFISLAALSRRRVALSALGILIAMLLHGTFDFTADVVPGHTQEFPVSLVMGAITYLALVYCVARSHQTAEPSDAAAAVKTA